MTDPNDNGMTWWEAVGVGVVAAFCFALAFGWMTP